MVHVVDSAPAITAEMAASRSGLAFSPCYITGFFRIHDRSREESRIGSTGAGVNLHQGVTSKVSLRVASRHRLSVSLNGKHLKNPVVTGTVVSDYLKNDPRALNVTVTHLCELPTGCGYGTSGAGALSLSLALNEALGAPLSKIEAAKVAHVAEVRCKTGLGTVSSVFRGGFVVRVGPGTPGVGTVKSLSYPPTLRVVSASYGPISTRRILSNSRLKDRINRCSAGLVPKLLGQPSEASFLSLSRKFADCLGLVTPRLRKVLDMMDNIGIPSSMMMLGEAVFSIVPLRVAQRVAEVLKTVGLAPVVSRIPKAGARLL